MRFLEDDEVRKWCSERGITLGERDRVRLDGTTTVLDRPFGQRVTPEGQEADVAAAAIAELGAWDECLLWVTLWSVWPSAEDWPAYYQLRGEQGERRSIGIARGHLFERGEEDLLFRFLEMILLNGWDAFVIAASSETATGRVIVASHHEWLSVVMR